MVKFNGFVFKNVRGHIEVFLNGVFMFSADTMSEARKELAELLETPVKEVGR